MALHPDITRKDDVTLALETAAGAMLLATRQQTSNAGSVTIPNADGSKTLMGADAGDATVARFVGRVTPPNRPTGIQAESHMGTLFVAWDGTLDGGMDAAFLFTRITITYTDADGDHSVDLGDLRGKGSVGSTTLPVGTVVTVTARAYDDAHDASGLSRPNVSAPSDPITVTVVDEATALRESVEADIKVVSDKADKAQGVADDAADANTKLREDTAKSLETVNTVVSGVRTDVDAVSEKAATLASGLDSANTKITSTSDKVDGLTTTVSNVSKTADDAMALSTTNHQDLTGFQTTVQQTYSTKQDTLSQVSAVSQKADSISASLSKDYQKKTDADATYATKTALQATSESITASVSETYATKSVVEALQNIADNAIETWQGHGVPSMTGEPTSDWTSAELKKKHSGDMYYDLDTGYSYRFGSSDGSTYTWDKISDSDITRAMQAAADAQSAADKANAGVSKLNTDIPATYAAKSDVKITTDGIKTDVSKAMTLGQTGIDNAATVNQKADGIQATVTQQAQTLSDNVKAIAQVNMRADSLSTSISQVNTKTDVALANAANYVKNPQFHGSNLDSVRTTKMDASDSNAGTLPAAALTYGKNTGGYDCVADAVKIHAIAGHTYRIEIDSKPASDMPSTETEPFGLMYCRMAADNPGITSNQYGMINATATTVTDWTHSKMEFTYAGTEPWSVFRPAYRAKRTQRWLVTNFACTDVTEVVAAQSTANTAVSQTSTLSQDLSGFKTSVGQTYETKTDSTAKATTAQQNLDGFKTSVASTYASKTDVANTYATKSDVTQTSDSLTSKISAVGTDATSALNKATTAQQNLDGFKTSVSQTYTKISDFNNASSTTNMWPNQWFDTSKPLIGKAAVGDEIETAPVGGNIRIINWRDNYKSSVSSSVTPGRKYKVSVDAKKISGTRSVISGGVWYTAQTSGNNWDSGADFASVKDYGNGWHRFETTITVPANKTRGTAWLQLNENWGNDNPAKWKISNLSFEDVTDMANIETTYSTKSYVDQTSRTVSLGVVEEYKNGQHGSALATQSDISIAKDSITSTVSQTYATKQALSDTDGKAVTAQNNANLAIANALECVLNGDFANGTANWSLGSNRDIVNVSGRGNVLHAVLYNGTTEQGIRQNDVGQRLGYSSKARVIRVGWDYCINSRSISGDADWKITIEYTPNGSWPGERGIQLKTPALGQWLHYETTYNIPANNTLDQFWFISRNLSSGDAADLYLDNISVKDITEVAQLQSDVVETYATKTSVTQTATDIKSEVSNTYAKKTDVANTYATKTSVTQTATDITSQVETKYATKSDVSSKYTTLQQTDSAFDARIGTAQSTAANAQSAASTAQSTANTAQSTASTAQSTANAKSRTYTSTPTTPYSAGDLYNNGQTVLVCRTARAAGGYTASDWVLAGDVTANNTAADTAKVNGISAATVIGNIGTAQSTAANAQSNAANAQNRAGVLETLIHSDANGVRVGKTVNGRYTGYSALVNANGSFDVLNPNADAIARFNSDNLAYKYGGQWYSVVSGFKHVATVSDLPATSIEQDRCIVDDVRREKVYQHGVWKNRSMLVTRYQFANGGTNPIGHVFMSVYYDYPTGMVTCIVDWDREITNLSAGNRTWTFGTGYPKALMPSHILDDANNMQLIVASSQASIVTIRNTGEVQFSTQRWNTTAMSHTYSGPATFPAAGGAWLMPGQDF